MDGCGHDNPAGSRFCLTCGAPVTMDCPACGAKLPSGARFCNQCGAVLDGATASAPGPAGAVGADIGSASRAAPPPSLANPETRATAAAPGLGTTTAAASPAAVSAAASPTAYTPRHLAERILTSRRALEGERKQVTVLFADLKGSMELLAERDPEDARRILDPVDRAPRSPRIASASAPTSVSSSNSRRSGAMAPPTSSSSRSSSSRSWPPSSPAPG